MPNPLETPRLLLRPLHPRHYLALLDAPERFAPDFGTPAAPGLGDFLSGGEVSAEWLAKLRAATEANPWVHGFGFVRKEIPLTIGSGCYKGPANAAGEVEVAYGIVPAYEGRGYATEAAGALAAFAYACPDVRLVIAHTLPVDNASGRVLTKNGFRCVGEVVDPEDGLVWRWELPRTRDA